MTKEINETPLTLHRVTIHNVAGIAHLDVSIEGKPVVVFGGDNEEGKTSILRALAATLGSEAPLPGRAGSSDAKMPVPQMIRDGELAGNCELVLGDGITVERRWTHKAGKQPSSKLIVAGLDTTGGAVKALQRLWSRVAVDLGRFEQLDATEQSNQVRQLLGLDWSELDSQDAKIREKRRGHSKEAKRLDARLSGLDACEDAPDEEVSTADLLTELKRRQEHNAGLAPLQRAVADAERAVAETNRKIDRTTEKTKDLEQQLRELERQLGELSNRQQRLGHQLSNDAAAREAAQAKVDAFDELGIDDVEEQLRTADETNRRVRARKEHQQASAELTAERKAADELSAELDRVANEKRQQLAALGDACPVEGLSFDQRGSMLLDERPYRENSTGRRLRFLVPLWLRSCPRIKVLLIDELPLDAKNLRLVTELAAAEGGQVIATRVGTENADFVVEAGRVKKK
jgi:hypothetical protein